MGAVWFEALTGARAVDGAGYQEVIARLLTGVAPRLPPEVPVSPALRDAIERALAPDRAGRHASMTRFARAIL